MGLFLGVLDDMGGLDDKIAHYHFQCANFHWFWHTVLNGKQSSGRNEANQSRDFLRSAAKTMLYNSSLFPLNILHGFFKAIVS